MKENLYNTHSIRTYKGIYMNVFEPTLDMIDIEDIAHALAQMPRFGGHLPYFYSVATHSLNASYLADKFEDRLAALLHDASEAYLMDIPRPIKNHLTNYKEIEHRLMILIARKFDFEYPLNNLIKEIDEQMLQTEWKYLMLQEDTLKFPQWKEKDSEENFLKMFRYYTLQIKNCALAKIKD